MESSTQQQQFLSIDEMIKKTNILLLEHESIKKQIKNNFDELKSELNKNKSEIDIFILFELTYIKTTLYKQINQKIRFYIQTIKNSGNN